MLYTSYDSFAFNPSISNILLHAVVSSVRFCYTCRLTKMLSNILTVNYYPNLLTEDIEIVQQMFLEVNVQRPSV